MVKVELGIRWRGTMLSRRLSEPLLSRDPWIYASLVSTAVLDPVLQSFVLSIVLSTGLGLDDTGLSMASST
jgi:hypothetical protein